MAVGSRVDPRNPPPGRINLESQSPHRQVSFEAAMWPVLPPDHPKPQKNAAFFLILLTAPAILCYRRAA